MAGRHRLLASSPAPAAAPTVTMATRWPSSNGWGQVRGRVWEELRARVTWLVGGACVGTAEACPKPSSPRPESWGRERKQLRGRGSSPGVLSRRHGQWVWWPEREPQVSRVPPSYGQWSRFPVRVVRGAEDAQASPWSPRMTRAGGFRQVASGQRGLARGSRGPGGPGLRPLAGLDGAWMARGSHWRGGGELGHSP